ncbi:leukosialin [Phascolarctos cinereus]|uniref:Leukosialin n=1 Tax=Phascolarctos cinereus TaxID=38626 RepID=A0A6P5M6L5_PHACI|nr:leukosialin [Phascolarctos cinereus]
MVMVSPLSLLLLLILPEWASTNSTATTDSQVPNTMSTQASSSDPSFSTSHLALEITSLPTSESGMVPMSSPAPEARALTFLSAVARDSYASTTEVASATTWAPPASGPTQVDKENPRSTQELATHTSTLAASVSDAVAVVTTASSIHPPSDTPIKKEKADIADQETTTLVIKETAYSKVISAYMTTSAVTSFQLPQTTSTSSVSLTNESPPNKLKQDGDNTLLVILIVVVLVATLVVVLFLLWRRRQKRRTGALMLVGSGKHKGAGGAWAGPVQVTEEQAASGSAAVEGGTGNVEGEGTGRRPTLTTFFGKRKSRQGSVMLEDLEAGTATNNLKDESEPLVENVNGVVKPPEAGGSGADGSGAGDGNLPSAPVTNV